LVGISSEPVYRRSDEGGFLASILHRLQAGSRIKARSAVAEPVDGVDEFIRLAFRALDPAQFLAEGIPVRAHLGSAEGFEPTAPTDLTQELSELLPAMRA